MTDGYKIKRVLVGTQQVYPAKYKREPDASRTLLYLPLESDVIDKSGNSGRTFTTSGLSYTTVGGVPSIHLGTTGGLKLTSPYPLQSDVTKPITVSFLAYVGTYSGFRYVFDLAATNGERQQIYIRANQSNFELDVYNDNTDSYYDRLYANFTANQWCNVAYTITSSASKIYINGQLADSGTGNPKPRGYWKYSGDNTQGIFCTRSVNSYSNSINGNIRELIMEQVEWSADDVSNYYNRIKDKLGF